MTTRGRSYVITGDRWKGRPKKMICQPCKEAVDEGRFGRDAHRDAGCKAIEFNDDTMCDCHHRENDGKNVQEAYRPK